VFVSGFNTKFPIDVRLRRSETLNRSVRFLFFDFFDLGVSRLFESDVRQEQANARGASIWWMLVGRLVTTRRRSEKMIDEIAARLADVRERGARFMVAIPYPSSRRDL
jgi:hypothetical protein